MMPLPRTIGTGRALLSRVAAGLPFLDTFGRVDGTLSNWDGATWAIASGRAVNVPSVGADMVDPGAGTFDSGTYSWVAAGTNTIANVSGELQTTYVNNADGASQQLTTANDLQSTVSLAEWYRLKLDAHRTGGDVSPFIAAGSNYNVFFAVGASGVTNREMHFSPNVTNPVFYSGRFMVAGVVGYLDNWSLQPFTRATLFAAPSAAYTRFAGDVAVRAVMTVGVGADAGVFCKLDSLSNPQSYVLAAINRDSNLNVRLYKSVSGTKTMLIGASVTYVADAILEIRCTGTTVQLWYNGAQVGTDQTVSDGAIASGAIHGLFSTSGTANTTDFWLGRSITQYPLAFLGGSVTNMTGWRASAEAAAKAAYLDIGVNGVNVAQNGQKAWEHRVRAPIEITSTPGCILLDLAPNQPIDDAFDKAMCEALIRFLRSNWPNTSILMPIFAYFNDPALNDPTLTNAAGIAWIVPMAAHYSIPICHVANTMAARVQAAQNTLTNWYTSPDGVHPNVSGHTFVTSLISPLLTKDMLDGGGAPWGGILPSRLYADSAGWEATPQYRNGADNDGETGTWTTQATTARQSTVAASTITWNVTAQSFGLDVQQSGSFEWQVDGGSWTTVNAAALARPINMITTFTQGAHTVTFRVVSGTVRINRFIAI